MLRLYEEACRRIDSTAHGRMFRQIRGFMITGKAGYQTGDKLDDSKVMADLQSCEIEGASSRTAYREAKKTLVKEGLAECRPGLGLRVSWTDLVSESLIHQIGLRIQVEAYAVSQLSEKVQRRQLHFDRYEALVELNDQLHELITKCDDEAGLIRWVELDLEFHRAIAEFGLTSRAAETVTNLFGTLLPVAVSAAKTPDSRKKIWKDHQRLIVSVGNAEGPDAVIQLAWFHLASAALSYLRNNEKKGDLEKFLKSDLPRFLTAFGRVRYSFETAAKKQAHYEPCVTLAEDMFF